MKICFLLSIAVRSLCLTARANEWLLWTALENADDYEQLLKTEISKGIAAKEVTGYRGITLLKRQVGDEMEFITFMFFDSLDAGRQFAGEEHEQAYVRAAARKILKRFAERSQHYEVREQIVYQRRISDR